VQTVAYRVLYLSAELAQKTSTPTKLAGGQFMLNRLRREAHPADLNLECIRLTF
jgi:hypothetical protein